MVDQEHDLVSPERNGRAAAPAGWATAGRAATGRPAAETVSRRIRVALVDDRTLSCAGMRLALEGDPDIEVIPDGGDLAGVSAAVADRDPDVVVLDLATPDHDAVAAVGSLREQLPHAQIVVLANERDAASAPPLMHAGALALVARETIEPDLSLAVHAAGRGERYVSPRLEGVLKPEATPPGKERLTTRETEVLRLIAFGHTSVEIAHALHLSPRTVETHRARIHKKLGLATRAELVRHALRRGLLRA